MSRIIAVVCFLLMSSLAFSQLTQTAPATMGTHATNESKTVVIHAGSLIDGTSPQAKTNQEIVIRGNHIVSVGNAGSGQVPADAQIIDLGSATVLPGLIDTHT